MYIPGRFRTGSNPLNTVICPASYEDDEVVAVVVVVVVEFEERISSCTEAFRINDGNVVVDVDGDLLVVTACGEDT
jgi:hypothetical protein